MEFLFFYLFIYLCISILVWFTSYASAWALSKRCCQEGRSSSGLKIQVFRDVTPCRWEYGLRRFVELQCLHKLGQASRVCLQPLCNKLFVCYRSYRNKLLFCIMVLDEWQDFCPHWWVNSPKVETGSFEILVYLYSCILYFISEKPCCSNKRSILVFALVICRFMEAKVKLAPVPVAARSKA